MSNASYMEKLLDGVEVEWKALGEVGEFIRGNGLQKKDFVEAGFPAIHYGQIHTKYSLSANKTFTYVSQELASKLRKTKKNDLLLATTSENDDDVVKPLAWLGEEAAVSGDMMLFRHVQNVKFLAYFFQTEAFQKQKRKYITGTKVRRVSSGDLAKMVAPIPCPNNPKKSLEIQTEIVRILDAFTAHTTELTARKKQYNYYRDQLLSFTTPPFGHPSKGGEWEKHLSFMEKLLDGVEVEWKALGEVLVRTKGTKITAGKMKELHKDGAPLKIFAGGKTIAFVDFEDIPAKNINREPSIIVKSRGFIEFEFYKKPFSHKNEMWSYHSKDTYIDIKYVYHFLKLNESHFQNLGSRMQMPQIATPDTDKFQIPIPCPDNPKKSLEIQTEIVRILDKFDTLTTSISEGLPREIKQRQQQYEYYRDLLLSFPKSPSSQFPSSQFPSSQFPSSGGVPEGRGGALA